MGMRSTDELSPRVKLTAANVGPTIDLRTAVLAGDGKTTSRAAAPVPTVFQSPVISTRSPAAEVFKASSTFGPSSHKRCPEDLTMTTQPLPSFASVPATT